MLYLLFNVEAEGGEDLDELEGDEEETATPISNDVSNAAIKAAIDFLKVSSQHTAFIAGKGYIEEELKKFQPARDGQSM